MPPTHPPWWRRQYRELKKLLFSRPSKCPIDLFGPVANGTILKQPQARSLHGLLETVYASLNLGGSRRESRVVFAAAAGEPTPAASLESLDLNRPEVQSYVAELLLDPGFDKFVGELGDYYDRLKKKLPSEAGGGATPFVPGRSGGTASKRTDPMDDD